MTMSPHAQGDYDYSDTGEQVEFAPIPANTILAGCLEIKGKGAGVDGMQRLSDRGDCMGLDTVTHVITLGPYKGRKIFRFLLTAGETEGQKQAVEIARTAIGAMIRSAFGFHQHDKSAETLAKIKALTAGGRLGQLNGLSYWFRTGIQPAKDSYPAKNTVAYIILPGMPGWSQLEQKPAVAPIAPAFTPQNGGTAPPHTERPSWA
jgi:hypothetical protein